MEVARGGIEPAITGQIGVLHVDDEPDFAEMTATFLEHEAERIEVVTETSGSDGLDRLAETDIDCIVADYDMPGMDGIEFLEAVREDYPTLPFVLFTGNGSEHVASEAISAGVTDYVQKGAGTEQYELLANRIENAVESSRIQLRNQRQLDALKTAREGISILDEDGTFVYMNEACADLYDRDPDELIGNHWTSIRPDDEIERFRTEIQPTVAENGAWHGETIGLRADGSTFVEGHARVATDRGEIVCATRDITDRKARERELREQKEQFQQLVQGVEEYAIFVLDPDGHIVSWNEGAARIKGYTEEEVLGEHFSMLYPEDAVEAGKPGRLLERAIEQGSAEDEDWRLRKDGSRFWASVTITALHDTDGDIRGFLKVTRDMTGRKAHERELQRVRDLYEITSDPDRSFEAKLQALFDLGCEQFDLELGAMARVDPGVDRFEIEHVSDDHPHFRPGVELPLSETYCTAVTERRGPASVSDPFEDGFAGITVHDEFGLKTYLGTYVEVESGTDRTFFFVSSKPRDEPFPEGERVFHDLMGQWVKHELEQRSREAEIKRQRDELQRQNERLDEFVSVVSHDLRNPLIVAEGNLELAQSDCNSEHLTAVADALGRSQALIEDLLTLAREGTREHETEPVELAEVVDDCWRIVETAEATLVVDTDRTIRADRSRLQQLLENLLRNAVEHGDAGVTITVGDLETGFYVADDGSGIPADERDQVFEYGYSTAEQGTGFGLSIVEEIAETHGWKIDVTDSEAGGTRIEITGVERP